MPRPPAPGRGRALLLGLALGLFATACGRPGGRPPAERFARALGTGAQVHEVVFADLTADGEEEALVAASLPGPDRAVHLTALVYAPGRTDAPLFRRRLAGEVWLPIQTGRPAQDAPLAAVFAARGGSAGALAYIVVQQLARAPQVTFENAGLLQGGVRFVPEGLLESRGDVDRILRWTATGWQPEDLWAEYQPPLPPGAIVVEYTIDTVRGPMITRSREIRARPGQAIFLRRMDRGDPSRIGFAGAPDAFTVDALGIVTPTQPGTFEIHIEGPAYSGRTLVLSVVVER